MKKIFFILVIFFNTYVLTAKDSIKKDICYNIEVVTSNEDLSMASYTCTIEYVDENRNHVVLSASSDVSAMDACNKAMRRTQTNNALD